MRGKFNPFKVPSKMRNVPTECDGFRFDSKLEARLYANLKLLRTAGEVTMFLRQVPFHLPGGTIYRVDFQVFYRDGSVRHLDAKGRETEAFKIKRREVEASYPVTIELWKGK